MSELNNVENLSNAWPVAQDNFEQIEARLWNGPPSLVSGVATTTIGPPTVGDWLLNNLWWDANGAQFICTVAGSPGTWVQVSPAILAADPVAGTIPTGYRIRRSDLNFTEKKHEGAYVWSELYPRRLSASASLDFPLITAGAYADLTVAVPGAVAGDAVILGLDGTTIEPMIVYNAFVSAADTVTVRAINLQTGDDDPAASVFNVIVLKY